MVSAQGIPSQVIEQGLMINDHLNKYSPCTEQQTNNNNNNNTGIYIALLKWHALVKALHTKNGTEYKSIK